MNVEVIEKSGISLRIDLESNERDSIKEDLDGNISEIRRATKKSYTDNLLGKIKDIL